jgi:DNA invertase Pin-like site-specific DNA recombinase
MSTPRLAVGYTRVSLEDENIENQVYEVQRFAEQNNITLVGIFKDIGVSGAKPTMEREGFKQMLNVLESLPAVRTIIVLDLTRLGRDMIDVLNTYKYLTEKGYDILFVKHPELNVVQASPLGETIRKATLALLGIAAEMERAFIRERTKSALARAKAQGKRIGRPLAVELPIDKVQELLDKGLTLYDVYKELKQEGYLKYRDKQGREQVLTYSQFHRRLNQLINIGLLKAQTTPKEKEQQGSP